ncbi:hypothetical protein VPH35_067112 [Triticum aestivum]
MAHRRDLAPGWTFNPPDRELTDVYLRREIDGQPIAASFMHHVDVYSAAPEKLVEGLQHAPGVGEAQGDQDKRVWYFFTTLRHAGKNVPGGPRRMSRTIAGADDGKKRWWHSEGSLKAVKGSAAGGALQKFTYKVESASGSGGWLMTEYSIHGAGDLVLCKVYKTPRPRPVRRPHVSSPASSVSSSSSCTTTAADLSGPGCKRKACGDHPDAPTTTQRKTQEAYVQMEDEVESYSARRQTDQDIEGFSFCTAYPTPVPQGDFHASASASLSSAKSVILDLDAGVTVDLDAPVVAPQSAPGAFVQVGAGLASGADSVDKILLYESGVTVDDLLDDMSNDGFLYAMPEPAPAPAPAPPCRNELLSAAVPPGNTTQNDLLHAPASNTAWNTTDGGCYGADSVDKIVLYEGQVTVDDLLLLDATTLDGSNDGFLCQDQEHPAASPCRNELLSVAVAVAPSNDTTSPPTTRHGIRRMAVATTCYPPTFLLPAATRKMVLSSGRRPPASACRTQHSICSGVHRMVRACTESATRTSYVSCIHVQNCSELVS